MPRLFPLTILLLPLALATASSGAQEPGRHPPREPGNVANSGSPRFPVQRDAQERWQRDPSRQPPSQSPALRPERMSQQPSGPRPGQAPQPPSPRPEQVPQSPVTRPDRSQQQAVAPDSRSISEAVRRVQRRTQGQILGAERVPFEGRNITRVKYMDSRGRVRYMDYMDEPGAPDQFTPRRSDNGRP